MPSTSQELFDKFVVRDNNGNITSDGIAEAESVIRNAGGTIDEDYYIYITQDKVTDKVIDAVQFLIEEWDYAIGSNPNFTA